jgi:uncharacterized protein (TIGR02611 family)
LQTKLPQASTRVRKGTMNSFNYLRHVVVAVIGFTVLLVGLAMIVLPGPAVLVIPLGLAILGTEFLWARRLLTRARATLSHKESSEEKRSGRTRDG